MEGGTKSLDTQRKNKWNDAATWVFSVWYNERYKGNTSKDEYDFCWKELEKIPPSKVDFVFQNPCEFFEKVDVRHLGLNNWRSIKQRWDDSAWR